jgi:hypothetical protein
MTDGSTDQRGQDEPQPAPPMTPPLAEPNLDQRLEQAESKLAEQAKKRGSVPVTEILKRAQGILRDPSLAISITKLNILREYLPENDPAIQQLAQLGAIVTALHDIWAQRVQQIQQIEQQTQTQAPGQ